MTIEISETHLEEIKKQGEQIYPNECCGFLIGTASDEKKQVDSIVPTVNTRDEENQYNRFLISPDDYLENQKKARKQQMDIVGFYHSHPNAEACPSAYDVDHAWPWYSYIILSVKNQKAEKITSWVLEEDRSKFNEEKLDVLSIKSSPF